MQPIPCIFLKWADLAAFDEVQQLSNMNYTSILANKNINYSKPINLRVIEKGYVAR